MADVDVPVRPCPKHQKASEHTSLPESPSSTLLSTSPVDSIASKGTPPCRDLLMPDRSWHLDPDRGKRHNEARRQIRASIFDNNHVDWKSIPAVEETSIRLLKLWQRTDLRCNASHQRLLMVLEQFVVPDVNEVTRKADGIVIVDGEELVDMIG